jgi:AAA domain
VSDRYEAETVDVPLDEPAHEERNPPSRGDAAGRKSTKFKLVRWGETPFDPNEEWLVKHILPKQGVGLIYGNSQGFKSFVSMHLALSVAVGERWGGRRVEQAAVVYLCAEGQKGFPKRERALTEKLKLTRAVVDFHAVYTAPNLGVMDGDLSDLIAAIEARGIMPGLVVIDTAAKVIGGADENGAGMAALLWNAGALAQHFGCFVLAVHHVGHGEDAKKRPRGWSGAIGNPDALILCDRIEETFSTSLTVQKEKDEASGFSLTVHLSRVVLGHDRDGDEISTLVVDRIEETSNAKPGDSAHQPKEPSKVEKLRRGFIEVFDKKADGKPTAIGLDGKTLVRKVPLAEIRDVMKAEGHLPTDDRGNIPREWINKFHDAKTSLMMSGKKPIFVEKDGLVWRIYGDNG